MAHSISGVWVPALTPFDKQLEPDAARFIAYCRWLLQQGANVDAIVHCASAQKGDEQAARNLVSAIGGTPHLLFISIVGIDNVHESACSTPPLTTYHVPKRTLGDVAVSTLDALITSGKAPAAAKIALAGHLVARESCSNPPD